MTKTIALITLSLTTLSAHAHSGCKEDEAYFDATIASVEPLSSKTCLIRLSVQQRVLFQVNRSCPLDLDEVLARGFTIKQEPGVFEGPTCGLQPGGTLAGALIRSNRTGKIRFYQE